MIKVVEPCCFHKQLDEMVDAAEGGEPVSVVSWGDVSLTQWLDFLVRRAKGAEVLLVLPKVLLPTLKGLRKLLEEKDAEGQWLVSSLTLISQGYEQKECLQELGQFRSSGRCVICQDRVAVRLCTVIAPQKGFFVSGALQQQNAYGLYMWQLSADRNVAHEIAGFFNFQKKRKSI